MSFLQIVEGPLFWVSAGVFVLGALWRMGALIAMKRRRDIAPPRGSAATGFIKGNLRHFLPRATFARRTWIHLAGGYGFHLGLFVLLLFAAPHIAFLDKRILGFSWPALPRWAFILVAEIAFAGLIILWVRRISDPVMRLISDADDHIGSWLTFLVMLSGCFALQQSHDALRATHMFLVDVWLLYFPFSRLMHAFTFVLSRGHTGATYGRKGVTP